MGFAVDPAEGATLDGRGQPGFLAIASLGRAVAQAVGRDAEDLTADAQALAGEVVEAVLRLAPGAVGPAQTFGVACRSQAARPFDDVGLVVGFDLDAPHPA